MLEIGHRVSLLDPTAFIDRILEGAYRQWSHVAAFAWNQECGRTVQGHSHAVLHIRPSFLDVPDANQETIGFESADYTNVLYDAPSGLFTPLDETNGQQFGNLLPDIPWYDPCGVSDPQEQTLEFFVHNHINGSSYHFSRPANCVFLETTDWLTVMRAHEAQDTDYRLYRNTSVFNTPSRSVPSGPIQSTLLAQDMESNLMASCEYCDGVVGIDGVCEPCTFTGVDLDSILDDLNGAQSWDLDSSSSTRKLSHLVTMRTPSSTQVIDREPGVHYSITNATTAQRPNPALANTDPYEAGPEVGKAHARSNSLTKTSQWECRCTPTNHLVCSYQGIAHTAKNVNLLV